MLWTFKTGRKGSLDHHLIVEEVLGGTLLPGTLSSQELHQDSLHLQSFAGSVTSQGVSHRSI